MGDNLDKRPAEPKSNSLSVADNIRKYGCSYHEPHLANPKPTREELMDIHQSEIPDLIRRNLHKMGDPKYNVRLRDIF
ncbi:MAG: hypothetical protein WCK90_05250 [archaeon]